METHRSRIGYDSMVWRNSIAYVDLIVLCSAQLVNVVTTYFLILQ